jgi:predicted ribosomally synthesized peptide with nif11-like leader
MASDAVRRFLHAVGQDEALKSEVLAATASPADRFGAFADVAARHGYSVTPADLQEAVSEMTEDDLAKVAGGTALNVASLGFHTGPGFATRFDALLRLF